MVLFFIDIVVESGLGVEPSLGFGFSTKNLLLYPLFMLAVTKWFTESTLRADKKFNTPLVFFVVFALYGTASLTFPLLTSQAQYDPRQGALSLKAGLIDPLLCFFAFWFFVKGHLEHPDRLLRVLVLLIGAACFLHTIEAVVPGFTIFGYDKSSPDRLNGPFGEPNQTSAVLSLCLPMAVALILIKEKIRIYFAATAVLILMSIVLTGSRGGIVGAGVGCVYLLWAIRRQLTLSNKMLIVLSMPVLAVVAWFILPEGSRELILNRFSFVSEEEIDWDKGSSGRSYIWEYALRLWKQSPIFGQGWNGFQIITGGAPHSLYINYIVSIGVVGLGIAAAFYWKLFQFYKNAAKSGLKGDTTLLVIGARAGLVALLCSVAFVDLFKPWLAVWSILGAAAGCCSASKLLERIRAIRHQT